MAIKGRKFDGKFYLYKGHYLNKQDALIDRNKWRKRYYFVRVVKTDKKSHPYALYIRPMS